MFQLVENSSVSQRKVVTLKKKVTLPCAQRLYKEFFKNHTNKLQQAHTKRGAITCQCLLKQTWGHKKPIHLFLSLPSPVLFTSFSMPVHLTNKHTVPWRNKLAYRKIRYLLHPQRLATLLIDLLSRNESLFNVSTPVKKKKKKSG